VRGGVTTRDRVRQGSLAVAEAARAHQKPRQLCLARKPPHSWLHCSHTHAHKYTNEMSASAWRAGARGGGCKVARKRCSPQPARAGSIWETGLNVVSALAVAFTCSPLMLPRHACLENYFGRAFHWVAVLRVHGVTQAGLGGALVEVFLPALVLKKTAASPLETLPRHTPFRSLLAPCREVVESNEPAFVVTASVCAAQ
jgi:hypothetical protein